MSALRRLRVLELPGLAPAPFCGMLLADFGAKVTRIDTPASFGLPQTMDRVCRNKQSIIMNLKSQEGIQVFGKLLENTDVLLDPFRPGTLEKMIDLNSLPPHLIVCRLIGFGQKEGPYRDLAGHDINYLATSGVLDRLQTLPYNIVADFAGGGLLAAYSVLAAYIQNQFEQPTKPTILDINLTDGGGYIANTFPLQFKELFPGPAGFNPLDGGAPFYGIYKTSDKRKMAVGPIEDKFFQNMLKVLELEKYAKDQQNIKLWPQMKADFTAAFKSKTRDEWSSLFAGVDACVTPVLTSEEAAKVRPEAFQTEPRLMPKPVPESLTSLVDVDAVPGKNSKEVLERHGFSAEEINKLFDSKTVM